MAVYNIYSKDGKTIKASVKKLTYEGVFMGECYVECDIESPITIDFETGDYIDYRNERFVLRTLPTTEKVARPLTYGGAIKYTGVRFHSLAVEELANCRFLDIVLKDNGLHFTSLPNFAFYAGEEKYVLNGIEFEYSTGLVQFADRLKANLNRLYNGTTGAWAVNVAAGTYIDGTSISVSNANCWDTLCNVCETLDINFTTRCTVKSDGTLTKVITLGSKGADIDDVFVYGKGNQLVSIERNADTSQEVVTRLRAYGNTRNIPFGYYRKYSSSKSMYIPNLMLPMFRENGYDAYVDSENVGKYGIIEGTAFFDGSDKDLDDIYPSITGMTTKNVYDAMTADERTAQNIDVTKYDQGNLDEVVDCEAVSGDGNIELNSNGTSKHAPYFKITLKNLGFNPNDSSYKSDDTPKINMKTGMCAGRDFEISSVVKKVNDDGSWNYVFTCSVNQDTSINQYFPNDTFPVLPGDKFVITGIFMPDIYIKAAEQRLLIAAKAYLADYDHTKFTYSPKINNIYMAKNPRVANSLKEGCVLKIKDDDIGIDTSITISQLKITEGSAAIPEYEVTLSDKLEPSLSQRVTKEIDEKFGTYFYSAGTGSSSGLISTTSTLNKYIKVMTDADGNVYLLSTVDFASKYGITAYATQFSDIASLMAGVNVDGETITKSDGYLKATGNFKNGIVIGDGISITWDSTNKCLVLKNIATNEVISTLAGHGITNAYTKSEVDSTVDEINESVNEALSDMSTSIHLKQDKLVSGTNIKTINNQSLLGSGNISIASTSSSVSTGGSGGSISGGSEISKNG